ncbi:MAG TPA: alpha/beta hydrolase-fold protein, partial [Verrucomicrobiae bacterium]|nr:alpha/beta hydrolase-fold protein [Verrucomicrobiae bacterium]
LAATLEKLCAGGASRCGEVRRMKSDLHLISRAKIFLLLFALLAAGKVAAAALRFEVTADKKLCDSPVTGRLLVILDRHPMPEPRLGMHADGPDAPFIIGRDVNDLAPGVKAVVDGKCITFPITNLSQLPAADYYVQALLMTNIDIRSPNSYGNLYSELRQVHLDPSHSSTVKLQLTHRIPGEKIPADTDLIKFIKIQSPLLSKFHGRPIYLRAGIVLPRDFAKETRKYPLWVRIGGWGTRYTMVQALMDKNTPFRKNWMADGTPRMILLQLDGAGPYGDPYQVNSANNGPYGDAITQELIPLVEEKFRGIGKPHARVLSGLSTGGWVSLALQVYYPDFFNGTWTFCPDGVDFRAFELVNIYEDTNTYVNEYGCERPSERAVNGDVRLYMRREVQFENVLGTGDSWTMSGKDWCAWNAVYGPRGADGRPTALWDPQTGKIDRALAEEWKKYDLRLVMEQNWKTLGPKLQGKLRISVGDADNYFLNNAVHLLDDFLSHADPPYKGRIVFGPGRGHGWTDITTEQQLKEMDAATGGPQD